MVSTAKSEQVLPQSLWDVLGCRGQEEVGVWWGRSSWAAEEAWGGLGERSSMTAGRWWTSHSTGAGALGTCEGLQLRRLRSARIDTRWVSRTNVIQITLWACDYFHQIRYSTWCSACASFARAVERQTIRMNSLKDRAEQPDTTSSEIFSAGLTHPKWWGKPQSATLGWTGPSQGHGIFHSVAGNPEPEAPGAARAGDTRSCWRGSAPAAGRRKEGDGF